MNKIVYVFVLLFSLNFYAQEQQVDSTKVVGLEEVIVIGHKKLNNQKQEKPLSSIDEYLEKSSKITMIKRGNYAWEPAINNMVSDRLSVTIDGMQIFGACTDKMDPITSYVDVSNLSEVHIKSGQQGSENGSTIGGGIDLKLQKGDFEKDDWSFGVDTGYETNGNAKIFSSEFNYSNDKYFVNLDGIYRKSDNYNAGGNEEVLFSQFEKLNFSTVAGVKIKENGALIGSVIYDKATNVGYPALTMDVSLAKALITSLSYEHKNISPFINKWETKLYYNTITHVMDDTKRPDVPIHMDMPGWSDTFGFYSKMSAQKNNHKILFNLNGYYNKSLAEMTMYPNDPNENIMFMLTWPDVRTLYSGVYAEDNIRLKNNQGLKVSARLGYQNERIASEFGLNSLRIFYPDMDDTNNRFLVNIFAQYEKRFNNFDVVTSVGYGERAPSVSESYGFYLYNSFDNFDYIGNPYFGNEKSTELNASFNYSKNKFKIGLETSFFYIQDYIIGEIDPTLTPMTIGSDGVKIYDALKYVTIFNTGLSAFYKIIPTITIDGRLTYNLGQDNLGNNLPLISPVDYSLSMQYQKNFFNAEINMNGAAEQKNFNSDYGEDLTKAYTIFNANASYAFYFDSTKLLLKTGVENIFDRNYSTFADWNNIPRLGRNVFLNVSFVLR
ncbi:MAG: TonB-dependent receptor [Flavobacteriaceae bacterium]|nr:TonB-dependent receptor [Flavobacteriaceae bacterium]